MRYFGSLTNRAMERSRQVTPVINSGATKCLSSDRNAYTVIQILSPRKIVCQRDMVKRIDNNGCSESQKYEYTTNTSNPKEIVTLRKNGMWITLGERLNKGTGWIIGLRDEYYDFNKYGKNYGNKYI